MLKFLMQYILTNNSALCWSVRVCSSKTKMESVKVNQNLLKFRVIRKMNGHIYYIENRLFVREFFWTADVSTKSRHNTGTDPGFQVRGKAHLNIFGVFRVKNHDFTSTNHISSYFRGEGGAGCTPAWIRTWLQWENSRICYIFRQTCNISAEKKH